VQAGVVMVNAGTFGSEPHMPFGGVKQSGNGSREPGTEALDIYSNLKDVYLAIDPAQV
jgi:alpha-ketoglutaric semialdehyde dehydrogenase